MTCFLRLQINPFLSSSFKPTAAPSRMHISWDNANSYRPNQGKKKKKHVQINSKLRPAFAKAWFFRRTERKTQNSRLAVILPASWHTTSRLSCNNITWLWGSAKYFPTHLYNEERKIAIRIPICCIVVSVVPLFLGKTSIKSKKRARKSISRGSRVLKFHLLLTGWN